MIAARQPVLLGLLRHVRVEDLWYCDQQELVYARIGPWDGSIEDPSARWGASDRRCLPTLTPIGPHITRIQEAVKARRWSRLAAVRDQDDRDVALARIPSLDLGEWRLLRLGGAA